jgi:adhesin transport system membrane fusion protein
LVKEGDNVHKNQELVLLDHTQFDAIYQEDLAKSAVLQANEHRLLAEIAGEKELNYPVKFEQEHPDIVKQAQALFRANRQALNTNLTQLRSQLDSTRQEFAIMAPLAKEGVVSKVEEIRLEREINRLRDEIQLGTDQYNQKALQELTQVRAEQAILTKRLLASKDRLERTIIRSGVSGTVNQIFVTSTGEVITPGGKIMDIVPEGGYLSVQAYIPADEIGFIQVGQNADIKVSAYDYSIYGGINAIVERISPDAVLDENNIAFYEVKLHPQKNNMGNDNKPLPLKPGMPVTVSIVTGEKTIMDYILKPFYKAKYNALTEK